MTFGLERLHWYLFDILDHKGANTKPFCLFERGYLPQDSPLSLSGPAGRQGVHRVSHGHLLSGRYEKVIV